MNSLHQFLYRMCSCSKTLFLARQIGASMGSLHSKPCIVGWWPNEGQDERCCHCLSVALYS